jgi:hypothetical protein
MPNGLLKCHPNRFIEVLLDFDQAPTTDFNEKTVTELGPKLEKFCRSLDGGLQYFVRFNSGGPDLPQA